MQIYVQREIVGRKCYALFGWNWLKRNSVNKHEKQRMNNIVFAPQICVSQKRVLFGQKHVICVKQRVILWYTDTLFNGNCVF